MRKVFVLWLVSVWVTVLIAGCGPAQKKTEITVFAAASLQETLTELAEQYMADHKDIRITLNFDSSGTLKTQIQEGAHCDIFLSAGQKQMDQLDITADPELNTQGLDFLLPGTRINLLENQIVLVVPEGNPGRVRSFEELAVRMGNGEGILAMGNADVPAGQYGSKILAYYGLAESELAAGGVITYSANVKEVTVQVQEAMVDCGIVYKTDAYSAGLVVVDTATPEMCGQVIYPAAVLKTSPEREAAVCFLAYLTTNTADAVFREVGFTPIGE